MTPEKIAVFIIKAKALWAISLCRQNVFFSKTRLLCIPLALLSLAFCLESARWPGIICFAAAIVFFSAPALTRRMIISSLERTNREQLRDREYEECKQELARARTETEKTAAQTRLVAIIKSDKTLRNAKIIFFILAVILILAAFTLLDRLVDLIINLFLPPRI
jgi:hypothetical protein